MNATIKKSTPRLILSVTTAAEIMTTNPVSIAEDATFREAVEFLSVRCFSAAPVIDTSGRPVGVLSQADILAHDGKSVAIPSSLAKAEQAHWSAIEATGKFLPEERPPVRVKDIMTSIVYSITPDTHVTQVLKMMMSLKVNRLFVIDDQGVMIGVVSAQDILRRLRPEK